MKAYIAIEGLAGVEFQPSLENTYTRTQSHIPLLQNSFRNLHSTLLAFQQFHSQTLAPSLMLKSMLDPSELSINVTGSVYKRPCAGTGRRRSTTRRRRTLSLVNGRISTRTHGWKTVVGFLLTTRRSHAKIEKLYE